MPIPQPRPRRPKPLEAGPFAPEIGSFRLHLAAEGKAAKTVRTYTEAVQWFAAAHLTPCTSCTRWEQVSGHDVQRWMVHLLTRYSDGYASNQFRALQQFFRWLAEEEQLPDPMTRLVLPADAAPVRRQCPQRPSPPHLRPGHGRQPVVVVAFEGQQRAWILLVGRHDDQDPVLNVYAELYRLLGIEPPDSAGRDKPPCCDESTDLPPVLGAAVTELVDRASRSAGQGARRRRYRDGARPSNRVRTGNSRSRCLPSARAAKPRSHQAHGRCAVTSCHRPLQA